MTINKIILGDNLDILRQIEDNTVDLIYLDPPFFSNRNYEVIWGDEGEIRSFKDRWAGGIDHYIAWLKERVEQMYRVLKRTGSFFLHCDWHANAYIKVDILDKIFGSKNFRGEIIWQRTNAHNDAKKKLAVLKDTIWYYTKSEKFTYRPIYSTLSEKYTDDFYKYDDGDGRGRYRLGDLTAPNIRKGDSGSEWNGFNPTVGNRHWAIPVKIIEDLVGTKKAKKLSTAKKLDLLYKHNLIKISKNNIPSFKRYLSDSNGTLLGDIWTDISNIPAQSKERIGYPTQKPEALLERIVEMASHEGDIVLDPFVGGGTTIAVTDKLKRSWIGIDQSVQAVKVSELRLQKQQNLFSVPFTVQLYKYDYDTLRYKNAFEFENWIVQQFGGTSNIQQRNDRGLDGKMPDNTPIQVKRSDNIGRNIIDNFKSAAERNDKKLFEKNRKELKPVGYIIAFSFGKGAIEEAARLKIKENIIIKLVTVGEIVPIAKKPTISIDISEKSRDENGIWDLELTANGHSDAGIEFYSWDCSYDSKKGFKPSLIIDKEGRHRHQFKAGLHYVAVKVV
ncbi:MAG: site-specific DNA-methyltransferase, partial [Planctomycetaceae bacterium]|nr:site-specific DNA-methyltransferase [Planctomycetaceae bacterium]